MRDTPDLDPETHVDDTVTSVWKRRLVLVLLIVLVMAIAAPTFTGCGSFFESKSMVARFEVGGETHEVSEQELGNFMRRYDRMLRLFSDPRRPSGLPEGEEGTKEALRVLMLDAAARAEGIRVPDSWIADRLAAAFQVGGKFDEARYRSMLAEFSRGELTHDHLVQMLRVSMRTSQYRQIYGAAFDVVPSDEAYENWKKRNVKLTVHYVAVPFEALRAKVDAMQPTDEELNSVRDLPDVKELLKIPPRKTVEIAYLRVEDITPAQYEAALKFAQEAELFTEDHPIEAKAFELFHGKRDVDFSKANWARLTDPDYARKKAEWDAEHARREKDPEKDKLPPEAPEPKDPAADYPTALRDQFGLWKDRLMREALAEKILGHLLARAEKEGRSLAEVGAEYARFGVKLAKNPEPLSDAEIVAKYPDPVVKDSDFDNVVVTRFKPAPEAAVFKPLYAGPVATTRVAERVHDRGHMVLRLEASDPARQHSVTEKRDVVVEFWRKHKVEELAKAQAEEIRKKAEASGAELEKRLEGLRQAAAEAGLSVQALQRFNRNTNAPKPPVAGPNEKLSPEVEAVARRVAHRNRVQQHYAFLSALEPGRFAEVLLDAKSQGAYVMLLAEKHEPTPLEMQDNDLRAERWGVISQAMAKVTELTGYDALAKRFHLERFDQRPERPKATETGSVPR